MSDYPDLSLSSYVVADSETTGLRFTHDTAFAVAISLDDGSARYYDFRDENDLRYVQEQLPLAKQIVNHHIKFDIHMLRTAGVHLDPLKCRCTMIAAALLDENEQSYSLDALARKYVGMTKDEAIWAELASLFGGAPTKKDQIGNLPRAPRDLAGRYAMQDTRATQALHLWQQPRIIEQELTRVYDVEHRLLRVLVDIEKHGVAVDVRQAERNVVELEQRLKLEQSRLDKAAGYAVNANSPPQMQKLLVRERTLTGDFLAVDGKTVFPATGSGQAASIKSEQLLHVQHPIAQSVVAVRSLRKTIDTFLKGHILGWHKDGRVHANFNQTKSDNNLGTGTGRLSVNDPPLQQINKRDKMIAPFVRGCFVPDHEQQWCAIDWSQMDFRVFAHYSKSQPILDAYAENPDLDYHGTVASLTGLPRDRKPGTGGGNAKQINLGMVFGMGSGRMAQEMGLECHVEKGRNGREWVRPGPEAEAVFDRYHHAIPGVRDLLATASAIAKKRGHVRTLLGRRIRFPDGQLVYKAAGLAFQGTAADCLKQKLVEVHELLQGTDAHLLVNVHDEFDVSLPNPAPSKLMRELIDTIEAFGPDDAISLRVPIRCSVGFGPDWWYASGVDSDRRTDYATIKQLRTGR